MDSLNVPELVQRLSSDEESVRKMAVFKLQNAIGDPSFADIFIHEGGLPKLRFLALHSTGNTLAYCLTSLSRLLELDKGWDHVTDDLIKRVRFSADSSWVEANGMSRLSTSLWHNLLSM
jgi:engulfment/cell motility protein 1